MSFFPTAHWTSRLPATIKGPVDQVNWSNDSKGAGGIALTWPRIAQSFTAGRSGGLAAVYLRGFTPCPKPCSGVGSTIQVQLIAMRLGLPDPSSVLAQGQATVPRSEGVNPVASTRIEFSKPPQVEAGTSYAIALTKDPKVALQLTDGASEDASGNFQGGYARGRLYLSGNGNDWGQLPGEDLDFVTIVNG
jgi:hypothetical protein